MAVFTLIVGGVPTVSAGVVGDSVAAPADGQIEDALRFRREQGLSEDRAAIVGLLKSIADPSDQEFGTPLTPEELALVRRRGQIQTELQPVRDYGADHELDW